MPHIYTGIYMPQLYMCVIYISHTHTHIYATHTHTLSLSSTKDDE